MSATFLGIDIGTSGVRATMVDEAGAVVAAASGQLEVAAAGGGVEAIGWTGAVESSLRALRSKEPRWSDVAAVAVDGTSGSMVLVDASGRPVTPGLMYDSHGFDAEAGRIAAVAPQGSITRGAGSALARLLRLQSLADGKGRWLCHQADFAAARLLGRPGLSDASNALKTGYDAEHGRWPDWMDATGLDVSLLPDVRPVGSVFGTIDRSVADRLHLARDVAIVAGATDSVAAFLAAGDVAPGVAVTSLGTTTALKILAEAPVTDLARGVYSHRVGDLWLPGGASNVGGGALLAHFKADELAAVSERIDPAWEPRHPETYPLPRAGERFPRNDPTLAPVLPPRESDARFLFELLHAIARVEREGYEALAALGAPYPARVLTAGGGARNAAWTAIRERVLGVPVAPLANAEASFGMALTARAAMGVSRTAA